MGEKMKYVWRRRIGKESDVNDRHIVVEGKTVCGITPPERGKQTWDGPWSPEYAGTIEAQYPYACPTCVRLVL